MAKAKVKKEIHPHHITEQIIHLSVMAFLYIIFLQIQLLYFARLVEFEQWIMYVVVGCFILISVKFTKLYWTLVHHRKQNQR